MALATEPQAFLQFHIGDRLRKARETTGMDIQTFAEEVGVHRRSLAKYEAGHQPRRPVLAAISMRTGVPIEWLLTGELPEQSPDSPGTQAKPSSACVTAADPSLQGGGTLLDNVRPLRRSSPEPTIRPLRVPA